MHVHPDDRLRPRTQYSAASIQMVQSHSVVLWCVAYRRIAAVINPPSPTTDFNGPCADLSVVDQATTIIATRSWGDPEGKAFCHKEFLGWWAYTARVNLCLRTLQRLPPQLCQHLCETSAHWSGWMPFQACIIEDEPWPLPLV